MRPPAELTVQDEEREAAEVVAVQMGQKDPADRSRVHAGPLHRDQRGRPAVDQERPARALQEEARLKAPSAPKRVARPEELKLNLAQARLG
jgi:hypothetical protein